ncbi:TetR/AcrR family transcriptional regulator [Chitinophaga defluvii]|uniref:TetR/AcrR family transcriptional regulator n=1 Tax=Chitinophaga defluvii TaxID=3163343 RepID=A0ABV2SZU4_9BACT
MNDTLPKDELVMQEIVAAAKKLFAKHGLKKTTMEDIAQAVGKGKSTIYYYYPGKNELFEAVIDEEMKNLIRVTRQEVNRATTAKAKLKAYLNARLSAVRNYHNLSKVVYDSILDHMCAITRIKQQHDETQINLVKEIIIGGIQAGEFKALHEEEIVMFGYLIVASFRGLEQSLSIPPAAYQFDALVDIIVEGIGQ